MTDRGPTSGQDATQFADHVVVTGFTVLPGRDPSADWLEEIYSMPPPRQGWCDLDWTPKRQRSPASEDGIHVAALGKVMVWVLTQAGYRAGSDPEVCGFHLLTRQFDDDCDGSADEVLLWAPMTLPEASSRNVA